MARWVIVPERIPNRVHVAIPCKQIGWIRHEGIRREELAQFGVIVAGVEVHQSGAVELLTGEARVPAGRGAQFMAAAETPIGMIPFLPAEVTAAVGGGNGAAQRLLYQGE